jgi:CRISPR-associated protein Cmr4
MKPLLFHVHALSALHAGTGQAVGAVDLPIAREKASNLPYLPGSSLKGVLRDEFTALKSADIDGLFGPERILKNEDAFAGALAVNDARLLLLPVRSMAGVMAWATCPFVLRRYTEELRIAGITSPNTLPEMLPGHGAIIQQGCVLTIGQKLLLDDLDLDPKPSLIATDWAKHLRKMLFLKDPEAEKHFDSRFLILSDDDFSFLADTSTEVRARIRINDATGTVDDRALWYEENLPAESILWGMIGVGEDRSAGKKKADDLRTSFKRAFNGGRILQLGGKASVGRGLVRLTIGDAVPCA